MTQRFEGRNLEEALQNAAETLGVERWQLTHHVLTEKRGFLGGVKRVVVEVEVNQEAPAPPPPPAKPDRVAVDREPHATPAAPSRLDRKPHSSSRGGGAGPLQSDATGSRAERGESPRRRGGRGRGRDRGSRDLRSGDFESFLGDVPEQGAESEGARAVREWCETVARLSRLDLVIRTEESDEQISVRLYGADAGRLTERNGELLDAMQVLANKALIGRSLEKDIELDSEEFKARRTSDLGDRARAIADRVRRDGREEVLPAMSPIERRIVHLTLQDDADVTTESRGEGFFKRVAIIPRSEANP